MARKSKGRKPSSRSASPTVSLGANPAYVTKMQGIRSSGAAGVHANTTRRPPRGEGNRKAIRESSDG